jgi:alanine dehydrogenase
MLTSKDALKALAREAAMMPQEQLMEVPHDHKKLFIGLPKETSFQENRVALVPEAVALLVSNGNDVVVESNAGKNANFQDRDYSEAGARIVYDKSEVFKAEIILKVAPPSDEEIGMLKEKQTLFSALQLSVQPKDTLKKLMQKKVTAIAWDFIKDEEGIYPVVRAMGEIAGNTSMLIAAEYLSNINNGQGMMLGGIAGVAPSRVIILGAGTVGEFAARAALGLGASVKIFDNSIYRLRRLQNDLGIRLYTCVLQPDQLKEALSTADVVIGALRGKDGRSPCVVTDEMVSQMKFGSVIVDVSIDQGGCFETSKVTNHSDPIFKKHGVIHYCVPNIPSRVSRTASYALSNIFTPILLDIADEGGTPNFIKADKGFRNGIYIYNGILTNDILGQAFDLPYTHLDLLLAAM